MVGPRNAGVDTVIGIDSLWARTNAQNRISSVMCHRLWLAWAWGTCANAFTEIHASIR
jgi:hypothetical protein